MTERTLSRSTSSLVRSKSLRLPSKNSDVIQENVRNVSLLSRSGSLRDKKNKDVVNQANRKRDENLLMNANQDNRDRGMSKSCHASLAPTNGELKRGPGTFSFRRALSRGSPPEKKVSNDSKRASPLPITASRPMRDYANDLKHLIAEHLELQQDYARVRQHLDERCLERGSMSPVSDLTSIPEMEADIGSATHEREIIIRSKRGREDAATEAYRREVLRLQLELHRMQKLYWNQIIQQGRHEKDESGKIVIDLLNQLEVHRSESYDNKSKIRKLDDQLNQSVREIATCRDALNDYQIELQVLRRQLKETSAELVETKESLQFAEDELKTMSDSLREVEKEYKESDLSRSFGSNEFVSGLLSVCADGSKFLEFHNILLKIGKKIEALVQEDCLFAKEQLDLSEDVLKILAATTFIDSAFESRDEKELDSSQMSETGKQLAVSVGQVVNQCVHLRDRMRARAQEKFKTNEDQILELKKSLDLMCRRHSESEEQAKIFVHTIEQNKSEIERLKEQALKRRQEYQNEVEHLTRALQEVKERNRCLHAVNQEQRRQLNGEITTLYTTNGGSDVVRNSDSTRDNSLLKQEISKLREEALTKDDLLRAMAAKFHRSQQLWEDNYQRVRVDLRVRDQQLDSVLEVLKSFPDVVDQCRPLKTIYVNLTDPNTKPIGKKIGVTNSVVASAV